MSEKRAGNGFKRPRKQKKKIRRGAEGRAARGRQEREERKEKAKKPSEAEQLKEQLAKEHDQFLRLAAEYDNFRKRSQREKDGIYRDAVSDTVKKAAAGLR